MVSDVLVAFDHLRHEVTILANVVAGGRRGRGLPRGGEGPSPTCASAWPGRCRGRSRDAASRRSSSPTWARTATRRRWSACKEYIRAGDAYQVVPSQRWSADCPVEAFSIYRGLRAVNPSPYMYFLDFEDFEIAGASPEPLVKVTGRRAEQRPIAGTRPRGGYRDGRPRARGGAAGRREGARRARDARGPRRATTSGASASTAAVSVDELMAVETYSHVIHIVSSVSGTPARGRDADGRAARVAARGHAVGRPEDPRHADHRRAGARASAGPTAARWATCPTPASSTPASTSAPPWSRTAACTCRRAAGSWPTPTPATSCARPRPRRARCSRPSTGLRPGGLGVTRVLVVDNYDSFTYNLVQYLGELGAELDVVRNDAAAADELLGRAPDRRGGVARAVHAGRGRRVGARRSALRRGGRARARRVPRPPGHGRGLRRDGWCAGEPVHGKTAAVEHDGRTIFAGLESPLVAGRYHSLVVDPELPACLERSASSGEW